MKQYIIRRLLWMIPTFLGITLISFLVVQMAPGDPVKLAAGMQGGLLPDRAAAQVIAEQRKLLGLDEPLWKRYPLWLSRLVRLDFGRSFKDFRSVRSIILEKLPVTLQINLLSIVLAYLVAIPIGAHSAVKVGRPSERIITVILFILYSLPSFWTAYILIYFLAGGSYLDVFPVAGINSSAAESYGFFHFLLDRLWHLVLPVTCLTYGAFAGLSRYMRSGMMEVLRQDYIRTARAKGLGEGAVIFKHAMRNSIIPIVTILAGLLPAMIGGSVIIETIFNIPGMGRLAFNAIMARDYPVIMAVMTVSAFLTLLGILLADIMYAIVDPRIRYE